MGASCILQHVCRRSAKGPSAEGPSAERPTCEKTRPRRGPAFAAGSLMLCRLREEARAGLDEATKDPATSQYG